MAQTPTLSIPVSLKPMEAEPVEELPLGKEWFYEPKYDGFRCHGSRLIRWRTDKAPEDCTMTQIRR